MFILLAKQGGKEERRALSITQSPHNVHTSDSDQ